MSPTLLESPLDYEDEKPFGLTKIRPERGFWIELFTHKEGYESLLMNFLWVPTLLEVRVGKEMTWSVPLTRNDSKKDWDKIWREEMAK